MDTETLWLMAQLGGLKDLTPQSLTISSSGTTVLSSGNFYEVTLSGTPAAVLTLPAPTAGALVGIKRIDSIAPASATLTPTAPSGATISGLGLPASATTYPLNQQNAETLLLADGAVWHIIAGAQDTGWIQGGASAPFTLGASVTTVTNYKNQVRKVGNRVDLMVAFASAFPTPLATLASGYYRTDITEWFFFAYTSATFPSTDLLLQLNGTNGQITVAQGTASSFVIGNTTYYTD